MKRSIQVFSVLFLLVVLLSACAASPKPVTVVPSAIPLMEGKGGLSGQVQEAATRWPEDEVIVYAAPFTPVNGQEEGFYVLEPNIHPHIGLGSGGYFQIGDVEPGTYVLIVGPAPSDGRLVVNNNGEPQTYTVEAGKMLNLGALVLAP